MSIKNIISKIGTAWYEGFADSPVTEHRFPDYIQTRKRLLVILPRDPEERSSLLSSIESLLRLAPEFELTFAGIEIPDFDLKEIDKAVLFGPKQLSLGTFPRQDAVKDLLGKTFDVSIDTNQTFDLSSALIPMKAGISARVGFAENYATPFYNIGFWGNSITEFTKFWKDVTGAETD